MTDTKTYDSDLYTHNSASKRWWDQRMMKANKKRKQVTSHQRGIEGRSQYLCPGRTRIELRPPHQLDSMAVAGLSYQHYSRLALEVIHITRQKNFLNFDWGKLGVAYDSIVQLWKRMTTKEGVNWVNSTTSMTCYLFPFLVFFDPFSCFLWYLDVPHWNTRSIHAGETEGLQKPGCI